MTVTQDDDKAKTYELKTCTNSTLKSTDACDLLDVGLTNVFFQQITAQDHEVKALEFKINYHQPNKPLPVC